MAGGCANYIGNDHAPTFVVPIFKTGLEGSSASAIKEADAGMYRMQEQASRSWSEDMSLRS